MWCRRTFGILAVAALAIPASASGAVLETLTVYASDADVTVGKVTLNAGTTYTLRFSGTYSQTGPSGQGNTSDALFCVSYINDPQGQTCSDHHRSENFAITTVPSGPWKEIDAYGGARQSYRDDHVYTVSFKPPATGVLRAGVSKQYTDCSTCETTSSGSITVEVSGPGGGSSGGGSSSGGGASLAHTKPGCQPGRRRALFAKRAISACEWGFISVIDAIQPGTANDTSSPYFKGPPKILDLITDVQNPEDERLFEEFVVTVVKARKRLKDQLDGCLLLAQGLAPKAALQLKPSDYSGITLVSCVTLIRRLHRGGGTQARASANTCRAVFVPGFRRGVRPSRATLRRAQARMEAGVRASCTPLLQRTQLRMTLRGRGGTLGPVLGRRAQAAVGAFAPAGAKYGAGARLAYSWGMKSR